MHGKIITSALVCLCSFSLMPGCLDIQGKRQAGGERYERHTAVIMEGTYLEDESKTNPDGYETIDGTELRHSIRHLLINRTKEASEKITDDFITITREIGADALASAIFIRIIER